MKPGVISPGSGGLSEELHGGERPELVDPCQRWVAGSGVVSLHVQGSFSPVAGSILLALTAVSCRGVAVSEER